MVWWCPGPLPCPSPPAPPHDGKPPQRGQTEQKGGLAIAKISQGCRAFSENPGIDSFKTPQTLTALRLEPSRVCFRFPGMCQFLPGIGLFLHESLFWFLRCFLTLFLFFSNERERERGTKRKKTKSPVFNDPLVTIPRTWSFFWGQTGDVFCIPGKVLATRGRCSYINQRVTKKTRFLSRSPEKNSMPSMGVVNKTQITEVRNER